MSAFEKTARSTFKRTRKNLGVVTEQSQHLFKVVVNNYKQQEKTTNQEVGETIIDDQQGLPPQPTGYLKFPDYDWF